MRGKNPNTEFFLVRILLYADLIHKNAHQKKLRISKLFTQCKSLKLLVEFQNYRFPLKSSALQHSKEGAGKIVEPKNNIRLLLWRHL